MTTPTTEEKLFALAAATAKMVKDGDIGKAMSTLNMMAHVCDDKALEKAKGILATLHEQEPEVKGVEDHFSSVKVDLEANNLGETLNIECSRFTHEEVLFLMVTLLGGNLRSMATEDDKAQKKQNATNITKLISMIFHWVTKEDWDKAHAMIDNRTPPEDTFTDWLSA